MFSTWKQKVLLGVYIFLVLSIPVGAYLATQRQSQNPQVSAKQDKSPITKLQENAKNATKNLLGTQPTETPEPSTTQASSFGPTMNLKLLLEGRPIGQMASKIFVGIADAAASSPIKYLLSFNIDLSNNGEFQGLSLAGLTTGTNYQAVLKGPAQIATSSAFVMAATVTNLNSGQPITLITGDLNEDNVINAADYSIARNGYGATSGNSNWNENIDFNKDGVINSADLSLLIKNMAKTGDSGVWISTPATSSASLKDQPSIGSASPSNAQGGPSNPGYWLWVPGF